MTPAAREILDHCLVMLDLPRDGWRCYRESTGLDGVTAVEFDRHPCLVFTGAAISAYRYPHGEIYLDHRSTLPAYLPAYQEIPA